jgi:broad specificity phosphatase PhoE
VTSFIFVRHGAHDLLDRVLAGRAIDVSLNAKGRQQARTLAKQLRRRRIVRILSGPSRRARETAEAIAAALGLSVEIAYELDEQDTGAWGGQSFERLESDPRWKEWNAKRGSTRPPGGESMGELQARIVDYLRKLSRDHQDETIVLVSHGEPIRATLLYCRGIPFDDFMDVVVPAASVTEVSMSTARPPGVIPCEATTLGAT